MRMSQERRKKINVLARQKGPPGGHVVHVNSCSGAMICVVCVQETNTAASASKRKFQRKRLAQISGRTPATSDSSASGVLSLPQTTAPPTI